METSQVYKADPMLISVLQVGKVRFKKINFSNVTHYLFWLLWVFVAAEGLSLVPVHGLLIAVASLLLWNTGSRVRGLFSSGSTYSAQTQLL